jgi:NADPH:quinone reductase-like Zn-dependent oxidoreductase
VLALPVWRWDADQWQLLAFAGWHYQRDVRFCLHFPAPSVRYCPQRARHPTWFKEDLERLFGLLATGAIRPHVAERISFDEVAEAHRRLEAGGLDVACSLS